MLSPLVTGGGFSLGALSEPGPRAARAGPARDGDGAGGKGRRRGITIGIHS